MQTKANIKTNTNSLFWAIDDAPNYDTARISTNTRATSIWNVILKLINYSWEQLPINEAYLGNMHEPW